MKTIKKYFYLLPAIILSLIAIMKLVALNQPVGKLPMPGMADKLLPLAILEIICVFLFVIPRTMNIGFFLICSYLGGAMAVNIFTIPSANPVVPAFLLALFWIGVYLKKKDLFLR
jgi:hypothetical protein